jgi:hypothetical protein
MALLFKFFGALMVVDLKGFFHINFKRIQIKIEKQAQVYSDEPRKAHDQKVKILKLNSSN